METLFLQDEDPTKFRRRIPSSLTVLYQLALGLEFIHKMGFVHRNLKPENVLIWVDPIKGDVLMKWADLGLSKSVNERPGSYSVSVWLAPEILKLLDEDFSQSESGTTSTKIETIQSDVFTEGLVFGYFLLKGVHLFGLRHQIHSNILENNPVNLDSKFIIKK